MLLVRVNTVFDGRKQKRSMRSKRMRSNHVLIVNDVEYSQKHHSIWLSVKERVA